MVDLVLMVCEDGVLCTSGLQIWWTRYFWLAKMVNLNLYFWHANMVDLVLMACEDGELCTSSMQIWWT